MPANRQDVKTQAIVIRRANYGEADRIITVITPEGKMGVLARGVRKAKSRLAGGIETFCLSEIGVAKGHGQVDVLTSAKMKKFYQGLLTDYGKMEVASEILKYIGRVTDTMEVPEAFELTRQSLAGLDEEGDAQTVLTWFYLNMARAMGEQVNLYFDTEGNKLEQGQKYTWDSTEKALRVRKAGRISTDEIKMMRLMLAAKLDLVLRVPETKKMIPELLFVAKSLNQL